MSIPPSSTAQTPTTGTTFSGEGLSAQQSTALQDAVNSGHQPWRTDPVQVAESFMLGTFGWTGVQASAGNPAAVVVTDHSGHQVTLHLSQPATHGKGGIWVVDSGVWN
ncbi:hypothetical protein [Nocardia sp.]|uniref:hypothetical protein n=1 Tax=Nocardia sp. TaxID=1821 RepID=UPI0026170364|nr:hypothetical protein [Nocardia sp.]